MEGTVLKRYPSISHYIGKLSNKTYSTSRTNPFRYSPSG